MLASFARYGGIDDAFIAFRCADHFVQGHGLVFSPGERVDDYTCILWVRLLSLPAALGVDLVVASKVFGALFAMLALVGRTLGKLVPPTTWIALNPVGAPRSRPSAAHPLAAARHFRARDRQESAHPTLVRAQPTAAARRALPAVPAPCRFFAQHSLVGRAQR